MLIKFNPSIAGYTNASIGTNKNMQGQPAFKAITVQDAFEIGVKHNLSDHRAQQLIDTADWIKDRGLKHFMGSHMYKGQMEDFKIKQALEELLIKAQSDK